MSYPLRTDFLTHMAEHEALGHSLPSFCCYDDGDPAEEAT